jgi:hypothetical protein
LVLGEWGGQLANPDGTWLTAFVKYLLQRNHTSQFFWCLNPNSGDTGKKRGKKKTGIIIIITHEQVDC